MKDMHCHLLYGIDDGSESIEESIEIIENASKQGITDIIITPHYIYNSRCHFRQWTQPKEPVPMKHARKQYQMTFAEE